VQHSHQSLSLLSQLIKSILLFKYLDLRLPASSLGHQHPIDHNRLFLGSLQLLQQFFLLFLVLAFTLSDVFGEGAEVLVV
jgi:hypothetical protein